jgi:hypothetical protein
MFVDLSTISTGERHNKPYISLFQARHTSSKGLEEVLA